MFCVIYRAWVFPEKEEPYQKYWHIIANYFVKHRGAIGSCLHKTEEGYWLAYSRWPNQATRDASWPGENAASTELPEEIRQAIINIKACVDQNRRLPEIAMNLISELLPS